jgi:tetratricopeptide (TPR) repeat protein
MRRTVRILAALALLLLTPYDASAGWTMLRSRNFLFIGDASERTIRATAQKLEQFRDVMLRAIPGAPATSPVPTVVLVFRNDASFNAYKPRFEGRLVEAAGLFLQSDDINYILVNADALEQAFKVVFHEYSHFLQGNWSEAVPVWMGEGLAEVYSTFQERDGGKSAVLGSPDRDHLDLLRTSQLIPVRELIAIDHSSPTYNEGRRRGVLYAESWALVHYLMFGNDARRPQLTAYLVAIKSGTRPEQAFGDAFGDISALDSELRAYIRRYMFPVIRASFGEKVDGGTLAGGEAISEAQAAAYLNDVLARLGQADAARAQLLGLIEKDAALARAACVLGLIELRDKRYAEALPLLERAATLAPDDAWIQTALGDALIRRSEDPDGDASVLLQHARAALSRAADRDDASARTLATFGRAHLYEGGDPQRAFTALERAVKLVPGREEYHLLLGHALVLQGDYTQAAAKLGPLVARAREPQIRDSARRLLGEISRAQNAEMDRSRVVEAEARLPPAAEAGAGSRDEPQPARQAAEPGRPPDAAERTGAAGLDARAGSRSRRTGSLPALREVRAGETRAFGFFASVECGGKDGMVLRIESERRVIRLSARTFDEVEFISYRKNGPSGVACGDQRPLFPVLATFRASDRPGTDVDGTAVAIEVVEDDYLPQ